MLIGQRIKSLRKERGWSQGELAQRLGTDARQISRYENSRMTPSAEAVVKIARVFDVSTDYLLVEDAARRPLIGENRELLERLQGMEALSKEDRDSIVRIIDALLAKNKLKELVAGM